MSTTTVLAPPRAPARPDRVGRRAVRDILPIAAAVVPFGTVVGVTLDAAGLTGVPALVATGLVYAGSAQLAALTILIAGGGPLGAVLAGAIVNARMLLYSASHGDRFRHGQPAWFRWVAPILTVDQTFALGEGARDLAPAEFRRYWTTIGLVLGAVWLAAVALGMQLGAVLPASSPMAVAVPATMVSLLVPHLGQPRMRRAALVGVVVGLLAQGLPSGLGIVVAIAAGLAAAGPAPEVDR